MKENSEVKPVRRRRHNATFKAEAGSDRMSRMAPAAIGLPVHRFGVHALYPRGHMLAANRMAVLTPYKYLLQLNNVSEILLMSLRGSCMQNQLVRKFLHRQLIGLFSRIGEKSL